MNLVGKFDYKVIERVGKRLVEGDQAKFTPGWALTNSLHLCT